MDFQETRLRFHSRGAECLRQVELIERLLRGRLRSRNSFAALQQCFSFEISENKIEPW